MVDFNKYMKVQDNETTNQNQHKLSTDVYNGNIVDDIISVTSDDNSSLPVDLIDNNKHFEFLTGQAGTGKTYTVRQRLEAQGAANVYIRQSGTRHVDRRPYGLLTATTGIAAVNLGAGVTTINSELKYFDANDLKELYANELLYKRIRELASRTQNLIVDECSMLSDEATDYLVRAFNQANDLKEVQDLGGIGLILVGDFCQLPPIKAKFAFEGLEWEKIFTQERITKLTKIWRQTNGEFLQALNAARKGDGDCAATILRSIPEITWLRHKLVTFEGTTIVATNKECDAMNQVRLDELIRAGGNRQETFHKTTWGKERMEWKQIPTSLTLCENAYVMILSNDTPVFSYVNGDTGYIKKITKDAVEIELVRNKTRVVIRRIIRKNMVKEHPYGESKPHIPSKKEFLGIIDLTDPNHIDYKNYLRALTVPSNSIYFDYLEEKWCIGEVKYLPLRLAYATTVHKSQGLSLDRVQIDPKHGFFGQPAMTYVALSRVRTPEGLTIVGDPGLLARRTNCLAEILPWL